MEIHIGIQHTNREIVFESAEAPESVTKTVTAAIEKGAGVIELSDAKGKLYIVPAASVAYVEVGAESSRRVGFVA